jgi:mercuric ion transport protein
MDIRWLLPLTGVSLVVAVVALAHGARNRRGHAPLLVGVTAAALVLLGKFVMNSNPATYLGTALLVGASVWNAWPRSGNVAPREGAAQVTP